MAILSAGKTRIKTHYRDGENKQHVVFMLLDKNEGGILTVRHPKVPDVAYTLFPEDSYPTRKYWWQLSEPAWVNTWLLKQGYGGSINIHDGKPRIGSLSDVQTNTILHTKVISEFLLADALSQMVDLIKQRVTMNLIVSLVTAGIAIYCLYLLDQIHKVLI